MSEKTAVLNTEAIVQSVLNSVDREREREIIARRYGLFDRKETLEQIGELLGITRERVRQLEKSVMTKLRQTGVDLPHVSEVEAALLTALGEAGETARITTLSSKLTAENTRTDQSRLAFLTELCPNISVISEDDTYFQAAGNSKVHDTLQLKKEVGTVVDAIKKAGKPVDKKDLAKLTGFETDTFVAALASISKQLATEAIKASDFKRKDVTTQAIHNELIKDKRFVLIGRGLYALKEWGYQKGTVADIISEVLRDAKEPLHRDEIVQRVLKSRFVKETTILLNLQSKPQFKRVAKATYELSE